MKVSKQTIDRKVNRLEQGLPFEIGESKTRSENFLTEKISEEIHEYLKDHPNTTAK